MYVWGRNVADVNVVVVSRPRLICYTLHARDFEYQDISLFPRATLKSWEWPGDEANYILNGNNRILIEKLEVMVSYKTGEGTCHAVRLTLL